MKGNDAEEQRPDFARRRTKEEVIERLVVVNNPEAPLPLLYHQLPKGSDRGEVFLMSNCARELWISTSEQLGFFNLIPHKDAISLEKWDAYEFLLKLKCGLLSADKGEAQVSGQMNHALDVLQKHSPNHALYWTPLLAMLKEDSAAIRDAIIQPAFIQSRDPAVRIELLKVAETACHHARVAREHGTRIRKEALQLPPEKFMSAMQQWIVASARGQRQ